MRPGGAKDAQTLADGLFAGHENDSDSAREGWRKWADQSANGLVNLYGGPGMFPIYMRLLFGANAASFFTALQVQIGYSGSPLLSNMRHYDMENNGMVYGGGPEQVWNQVFFYYEATFTETAPAQVERDMNVDYKVYSNMDKADPTDMPATISASGEVVPGPSLRRSLLFVHDYRLVFGDIGFPNPSDPRNDWVSLKTSRGYELYAPTELNVIASGYSGARKADPGMSGNPAVGSEFLTTPTPAPTINARYR